MVVSRFAALAQRLAARTDGVCGVVTFTEATGEVCDAVCRSTAHLDRVRAAAGAFRLSTRP